MFLVIRRVTSGVVDVASPPMKPTEVGRSIEEETVLTRLLPLFEQYEVPVTWGFAAISQTSALQLLARANLAHEVALLAEAEWFGPGPGRGRLNQELTWRLEQARLAGRQVSTIVARNTQLVLQEETV